MATSAANSKIGLSTAFVSGWTLQDKLKRVITKAAAKLPGEVGRQLLALVEPIALATMAGVVVVWAGAQFFGVGEIADVVLVVAGWVAFGGVAFQAGRCLFDFAVQTGTEKCASSKGWHDQWEVSPTEVKVKAS